MGNSKATDLWSLANIPKTDPITSTTTLTPSYSFARRSLIEFRRRHRPPQFFGKSIRDSGRSVLTARQFKFNFEPSTFMSVKRAISINCRRNRFALCKKLLRPDHSATNQPNHLRQITPVIAVTCLDPDFGNLPEPAAGSTGRCNIISKFTCRSLKAQSLSRALIEAQSYLVEIALRVAGQVGFLGKVLSQ